MQIMKQADVDQSASLHQQQQDNNRRLRPNLPRRFLLNTSKEDYFKIAVPLYEASFKCDWVAARAILNERPALVRYSITENSETALHIAASAKGGKHVKEFVENLVEIMTKEDLALENENFSTALFLAAVAGNIDTVKIMVEKNRDLVTIPGAGGTMMPLYAATSFGNPDVVNYLYKKSNKLCDDGWTTANRGSLLELCVDNDMFDIAKQILTDYSGLASSGRVLEALARNPDAFHEIESHQIMINFETVLSAIGLKVRTPKTESDALKLLRVIWENLVHKPKKIIDDIMRGPPDLKQEDTTAFGNVDQRLELQKHISERLVSLHVEIQNTIRGTSKSVKKDASLDSGKEDQAQELQNLISGYIAKMHVETQNIIRVPTATISPNVRRNATKTYSSRIMFVAAKMGNTRFIVELIHRYPDLIWKVNDKNQSIFHVAARHRHQNIYNLLYQIGSMKDMVTPLKDVDGNNMLHLVAKIAKKKKLSDISGVAFQMQRELLWFQEVAAMLPTSFRIRKNKDGLTPYELFSKEHEDLLAKSEKWMKGTASQCMVVAALIATIVFAAAFTVPGGFNQNTGIPIFYRKQAYIIFVMADAISLFSSSASTLMFISILTSRYAERDFLEILPKKLMVFLSTLCLSIVTMMIVFTVSFLILYQKYMKWMIVLIFIAALPVLLFAILHYPLFT